VPAKRDPNPGKLELLPLFFSSLIFISFEKAAESRFRHKHDSLLEAWPGRQLRFEYRLEVARIAAAN
jgi:hypothetical protein